MVTDWLRPSCPEWELGENEVVKGSPQGVHIPLLPGLLDPLTL
jgi:hypothetical protein